jgi:ATP phosphoribosyltransferase
MSSLTDSEELIGVQLALPKGRMNEEVVRLIADAGIKMQVGSRNYRPKFSMPGWSVKLLKPQNIVKMLHTGTRDVGFAGADWVTNLDADVVEVLDLKLNPVRVVVASLDADVLKNAPTDRKLRVASEYVKITEDWIAKNNLNAELVRAFGATECFPPDDADLILDNTATGATLVANGLKIIDTVLTSTTRLYASKAAWADPYKREQIETLALLLQSALDAQNLVVLEFCDE